VRSNLKPNLVICKSGWGILLPHPPKRTCQFAINPFFFIFKLPQMSSKNELWIERFVVRIHIVIQHTSLTYHTHIHTQTHNMDESIHKYMCTTIRPQNDTKNIYYHTIHDANIYSQAKPTPLKESMLMLKGHHSSKLH